MKKIGKTRKTAAGNGVAPPSMENAPVTGKKRRAVRGNAVAPPPPMARHTGESRVGYQTTPSEWKCPKCAEWSGYLYGYATDPDARCADCGKPVEAEERKLLILRQLGDKTVRHEIALPSSPSALTSPGQLPVEGRSACTVEEAGHLLGCKATKIYELLDEGRLQKAPKFGKKTMVLAASIKELQQGNQRGPPKRSSNPVSKKIPVSAAELQAAILGLPVK